ncbi:hypothetical protein [Cyanobium sp. Morenito 9A2]|uniref:hypothetical protein n=1 Tax=Cyanobium sp. Morenito 9A2 TaxID=2823718 RepID=UPI0020CDC87C|nr:hypothetical protein [Cyanobium sp. Morenito 9A2]MCP9851232.1 hypothetical protein [Cyanobium sp. Morenito 9A2]
MAEKMYSRREVERSFRKFSDIVSDLMEARHQTWGNSFDHLIEHCKNDQVMQIVLAPLARNKSIDAVAWYQDAMSTTGSMVGTGRYTLPYDDEERTALLYQFFVLVAENKVNLSQFCQNMYGTSGYHDMARVLNSELVAKFTREIQYRLNEILVDTAEDQEISKEAMTVFHYHDNSINVSGPIQGSNISTTGSSISGSTASFEEQQEVASELAEIRRQLAQEDTAKNVSKVAIEAIDKLIHSASDPNAALEEVSESASIAIKDSPLVRTKLVDLCERIGVGVASSTIVLGIKAALGL